MPTSQGDCFTDGVKMNSSDHLEESTNNRVILLLLVIGGEQEDFSFIKVTDNLFPIYIIFACF